MNDRTQLLEKLQAEAVQSWYEADGRGTIHATVAFGKTFTAFKCLYKLLDETKIEPGSAVHVMAETQVRERTFIEEADKFADLTGRNPYKDFSMSFSCYQALLTDESWQVLIADEIHMGTTAKYSYNFIDNKYDYIIGLSGTPAEHLKIYREDEDSDLTKGDVLRAIAPIVYSYSTSQGITDGILAPFETVLVYHELDSKNKVIPGGTKAKPFLQTEKSFWDYAMMVKSNYRMPEWRRKPVVAKACRMLWNLPSKQPIIEALMKKIPGKKLIFSNELELLHKTCDHVVHGGLSRKKIDSMVTDFNEGRINTIASAKMLKQGVTLTGLEAVILASYYSGSHHIIQQIGRALRFAEGKTARVYIIVTRKTYESRWLSEAVCVRNARDEVVEQIDLNVVDEIESFSLT